MKNFYLLTHPQNWRITSCQLTATAYAGHSQLHIPSIPGDNLLSTQSKGAPCHCNSNLIIGVNWTAILIAYMIFLWRNTNEKTVVCGMELVIINGFKIGFPKRTCCIQHCSERLQEPIACLECGWLTTSQHCNTSQKSKDLIYTMPEAWNHTSLHLNTNNTHSMQHLHKMGNVTL